MRTTFSVLAIALLAPVALATPISGSVPNGDFEAGDSGWDVVGLASISGGTASLGIFDGDCWGPEPYGIVGSITTKTPVVFTRQLEFDYVLSHTLDLASYSGLLIQHVNPVTETVTTLARFNPNPSYGSCSSLSGHAVVPLPPVPPGLLRIGVFMDAFGDPYFAQIDNVAMGI